MPAIENVAGVPAGVLKSVAQQVGTTTTEVSDVKVNVKAAELNAWLPTEPLPVPENVMESGLAAAIPANKILVKNRRYGN